MDGAWRWLAEEPTGPTNSGKVREYAARHARACSIRCRQRRARGSRRRAEAHVCSARDPCRKPIVFYGTSITQGLLFAHGHLPHGLLGSLAGLAGR